MTITILSLAIIATLASGWAIVVAQATLRTPRVSRALKHLRKAG